MGKWKVWLLGALGILGSLAVWVLLGRNVWHATSSSSGTNDVCRCDTSGHKVSFVTVEPGVQLEVLDWGGTGQTLVLLAGMGDNAGARESWSQARSELEPFLKEQPENFVLLGDLALTNMGLGDNAAALTLTERAIAMIPIKKDALTGPRPLDILARVAARIGDQIGRAHV